MVYVIQPGDTLFLIAIRFGITIEDILDANPQIIDPDVIFAGQVIGIPLPDLPPAVPGITYIIQPGDTLFSIAQQFGVNFNELVAANPQIADPNIIFPGQFITIPAGPTTPPIPPSGFNYVVQPGDTLSLIAQQFGVNLNDLIDANPEIEDPNLIFPGQVILIPVEDELPPPPSGGSVYIVQQGDTLFGIAQQFGADLDELIATNPQITDPDIIFAGQFIVIPPLTNA